MSGFVLHPEATTDLEEIWEYIASDNLDAADSCPRGNLQRDPVPSRFSLHRPQPSRSHVTALAVSIRARLCDCFTRRMRSRSLSSRCFMAAATPE